VEERVITRERRSLSKNCASPIDLHRAKGKKKVKAKVGGGKRSSDQQRGTSPEKGRKKERDLIGPSKENTEVSTRLFRYQKGGSSNGTGSARKVTV